MKKKIYKYSVGITHGSYVISMPKGAKILTAHQQTLDPSDRLAIWAEVNPEAPEVEREIVVVWTGKEFEDQEDLKYITTVHAIEGTIVCHIYEKLEV